MQSALKQTPIAPTEEELAQKKATQDAATAQRARDTYAMKDSRGLVVRQPQTPAANPAATPASGWAAARMAGEGATVGSANPGAAAGALPQRPVGVPPGGPSPTTPGAPPAPTAVASAPAMPGGGRNEGRVGRWLPGQYNAAQPAVAAGLEGMTRVLRNPSALPPGAEERALMQQDQAYQTAENRMRANQAANASAYGAGSGTVSNGLGNVEMARGAGMADAAQRLAIQKAQLEDERLRGLALPLLGEQNDMYKAAMARTEEKKKRNWMQTIAGLGTVAGGIYTMNPETTAAGLGAL